MGFRRPLIAREWRMPKIMLAFFILELPLTVALLTLFGVADPNTYRTKLWQNGADQGFNSSPSSILYAYANYKPISVPLVWSQFMTDFNVVVAVLSMFILLVKVVAFVMHIFLPLLSFLVHLILIALYAVSLRNQTASDLSDPKRPSTGLPWYLSKGCGYATQQNYGFCMQARASYGTTIVLLTLFCAYFIYSAINLVPSDEERSKRQSDIEMTKVEKTRMSKAMREEQREHNRQLFLNLPKTPTTPFHHAKNPMTPRTVAFTKLSGDEQPIQVSNAGPSRKLPFREHYGGADGR